MNNRLSFLDDTCSAEHSPRHELVDVLERYMADLERGAAPSPQNVLDANPTLADELRPYLESLKLLDGATRDLRGSKLVESESAEEVAALKPRQIGDYRLMREVGRGGMGVVYEAHQISLNRRVALKILPFAAVLDRRQIARFRNEAQAAAQLHHPHIVPVFAVGQEQGVYYYAMQFIDGRSLDQAITELHATEPMCSANTTQDIRSAKRTTTACRVRRSSAFTSRPMSDKNDFFRTVAQLGKQAAEALQHAHEHGIVHRDIKPSNLMIDHESKLWVTDFGLARIQSDHGVTLTGDVVGTLRYMSPEQASGSAVVDAQADIYSLGVTLYEFLTQNQAHLGDDRQTLLRHIVDREPILPRKIDASIPADLETIVLAAMAKSRHERYPSAQALADDLQRFLDGKPTFARRPSLVDRASKWARRHRSLVTMAVAAMLLVSVVSAIGMVRLAREQKRTLSALTEAKSNALKAQENFERAERHFRQARNAVDQFGARLSDRLGEIPGAEAVRRDLLVDTLSYYRQFAVDAGSDPQLRQETALAHLKTAAIAARLGAVRDAIQEYELSQKGLVELINARPADTEARTQLAVSHNNLGLLYAARSETERAKQQYTAAIEIRKQLALARPSDSVVISQLSESEANLGLLLDQVGDTQGAEQALVAAANSLKPLVEQHPDQLQPAHDLAIALNNLSYVVRKRDISAAEQASQEAIAVLERMTQQAASGDAYQDDLALCYNNRAALESQRAAWEDAIIWHRRAIGLQEQLVRKSPAVVRYRSDLAISLNNLGVASCRAAKAKDADEVFRQARELFTNLADDYPDELAYRSSLAALLNNQALALAGVGRHADALEIYAQAIEAQQKCVQSHPRSEMMRDLLSKMYYNLGRSLQAIGNFGDAAGAARARRDLWTNNGERLLGVAAELAELSMAMAKESAVAGKPSGKIDSETVCNDVLATLDQAYRCGWPRKIDLGSEQRFSCFKQDERFAEKIAELNERASVSTQNAIQRTEKTSTNNN